MDFKWFLDELKDEVEGAAMYAKRAIEIKAMSEKMSKTLYEMSLQEADHAKKIFDMGMEYYSKIAEAWNNNVPEFIEETKKHLVDCYTDKIVEIKMLQTAYKD